MRKVIILRKKRGRKQRVVKEGEVAGTAGRKSWCPLPRKEENFMPPWSHLDPEGTNYNLIEPVTASK